MQTGQINESGYKWKVSSTSNCDISNSLRYEGKFFLVLAKGVMGNPVALLVVVSPRVKFHSEECC